jgi:DNA-directed RNA polymerase specialized sigma24 family protein
MADVVALIEQQIPALRRYAFALLRDHDAADDLVQDTLQASSRNNLQPSNKSFPL